MLYSFDDYTLDPDHYELRRAGRLVRLAPRVFDLVAHLVRHAGRVVTNEELKERLWPGSAVVGEASLATAVAQARKALGDTGQEQRYIQTVHRRGYRFMAPVTAGPPGTADLPAAPPPDPPPPVTPVLDHANVVPRPGRTPPVRARATGRDDALHEGSQADPSGVEIGMLSAAGRCSGCGGENPPGMKFCSACGLPLGSRCPGCGAENGPGAKFCGSCGAPLMGRSLPLQRQPNTPRPQTPLSYTPVHLAEKILTSRSALEGERKQVTVLLAKLRGAMESMGDRDPEESQRLIDPLLERMLEAVHRYEGTVHHISGDSIEALFGAPLAHEDHAARACYAALAMQKALHPYIEDLRRRSGIELQLWAGLNSGEVVVRSIGNDLHMEYSAVGHTMFLAARMEQLARHGGIWLVGETLRLVEGLVQVKPLGPVRVEGLTAPVQVFELTGAEPTRTRLQAASARVLTPFVGRQHELETLRQALGRAGAGHGQVVAVIGEPGVGKSRLCYELTHPPHTRGWLILEAGAVSSYGQATPYLPVIDLLRAYFQVEGPDDGRGLHEKVADKLLALDEALRPTLPAFLMLLDAPFEDPQWQKLDPPQRRQRTLEALKRLLLRESQIQPLLLIVENLHWIDTETQTFLDSLIESLPSARMLLLLNYRPDYQHRWGNKSYYTQIRLDPLPPASAEELLQTLLGRDAGLQPLKQRLIERTEGNPFFLEESVRTLAETKALSGESGAYRMAQALPSIQVPTTVHAMLAARIDRLPPEDKRLLQAAAVIGRDVPFLLLQAIAEEPDEALRRSLAHLQAAEFLYEMSLFPELEYTFKHALTQEVAYGSLLQEQRRPLHARIVEAIEQRYPYRLDEQVERLANHAFRGEVWEKALTYFRRAGAKAVARSANREAVSCFEQALTALEHLPESRDMVEQAVDLRFDLRKALVALGELKRIHAYLREAETLAEALSDRRRLWWVRAYMTNNFWLMGDLDRAISSGQRALADAVGLDDLALQVIPNYCLGRVYQALGDYGQAMDFFKRNMAFLEGDSFHEHFGLAISPTVFSRMRLAWCLAELGEFTEAIARGEEGVRMAEALDHPWTLAVAYFEAGLSHFRKGDLPKAIPILERGLELCRVWDISLSFPPTASTLGSAYALSGRVAEALPLLELAVDQATSMGYLVFHSLWVVGLSEAYLLDGRREEALKLGRRALDLSRDHQERGHQAYALRLLGEITMHQVSLEIEQAESFYRQALTLAKELGMRPLQAHCHRGLGTLHAKIGRTEQAYADLIAAIELYRTMEMTFWLPQTEAMLAQLEGR
jgi:class 3 adenylate cyclase/DNA-binding winged helix-turn-helix (wHTH) protein/tetratricopeptide (TPR) repeat protein